MIPVIGGGVMKVYARAARFHHHIDQSTGEHEFMLRYRIAMRPDQDGETLCACLRIEADGILRKVLGADAEIVALDDTQVVELPI